MTTRCAQPASPSKTSKNIGLYSDPASTASAQFRVSEFQGRTTGHHTTRPFCPSVQNTRETDSCGAGRARRYGGERQQRATGPFGPDGALQGQHRLPGAGSLTEDWQDLLGHKSGRVTSHYSTAELGNLIEAANQVVGEGSRKSPALVVLEKKAANA